VGQQYADEGHRLLILLMAANIIRLAGMTYSVVLVASAQQRLVTLSPLMEGFTNVFASIVLGMKFGAIGVAAGTLIGGVVGMLGHIVYNMPRTRKEVAFNVHAFRQKHHPIRLSFSSPTKDWIHLSSVSPDSPSHNGTLCLSRKSRYCWIVA
jgi:Na+-driven multidrug efflux pump